MFTKIKDKKINKKNKVGIITKTPVNASVYFFTLLIQALTKLLELIGVIIIFALTSLGLTILFNEPLRRIMFQIFQN